MKKITLFVSVLLFLFTAVANAHGPVRQKAEEEITINAPAEKVWAIIKDYGDLSWLPEVKSVTVDKGNEKGFNPRSDFKRWRYNYRRIEKA